MASIHDSIEANEFDQASAIWVDFVRSDTLPEQKPEITQRVARLWPNGRIEYPPGSSA